MQKLVKEGTQYVTTLYLGGFQYESNLLQFFPQAEGYVENYLGTYKYIYNYTDHLGNIRLSYEDKNKDGQIEEYQKET